MSEKWLRDLDVLDRLEMPATVRDRVGKSGHRSPSGHPLERRLITIGVAFAVFVGAGVFAWQAFRTSPRTPSSSPPESIDGTILWPEQTGQDLAAAQALADSGDPSVAWRLDPKEVATRFAEDVLGWGAPGGNYEVTLGAISQPQSPASEQILTATLSRYAIPCPTPFPGEQMACPPPFSTEVVSLRQPGTTGASGVWTVESVRAVGLDLGIDPGALVQNGDSIDGDIGFPATAPETSGYTAQGGFFVGQDPDCSSGSVEGRPEEGAFTVAVAVGRQGWSASGCAAESAGLAWIATASMPECPQDVGSCAVPVLVSPDLHSNYAHLFDLTAIPILVSVLEDQTLATPTTQSTASPSGSTTYTDDSGWTMEVPASWTSSRADPSLYGSGGSGRRFEGDGLVMQVWTGTTITLPKNDSMLPLSFDGLLQPENIGWRGTFSFDGRIFGVSLDTQSGSSLSASQSEIVSRVISSIQFPSWEPGDTRNGWTALSSPGNEGPPSQDAGISWQCVSGGNLCDVLVYGGGAPYLLGPIQTCGEGENMTADPTSQYPIVMECPNDPTQSWTLSGQPAPSNMPANGQQLDKHPVIVAWDGTLLTNIGATIS